MKKHFAKTLCLVAVCALTACILVACQVAPTTTAITVNGAKQVYTGEFDLADYSIVVATSDGNMRTEPLTAQNLANVTVEQLQKAGVYNISVVYDGVTTAFTLTVANRTFEGITFADKTVTYNGTAQSIEVANLPQGATVSYSPSNTYTNAGMYPVTATVSAPDFDTITLSATLTITRATHKVTFRQSGQPDKAYDVLDLADFVEAFPEVVAVAGYDIVWETKNLTCVTHNIIVNAVITPTVYGITYVLDGGTNPDGAPSRYTIKTKTFTPPVPTKEGYTFDGWYTENTFVNQVEQISQGSIGNVTLYAKWQRTSTEGLRYNQLQDGSYAVSGYDGDSCEVLIPLTWKGQPVTTIGYGAFCDCSGLTSITIPDGVTSIDSYAFSGCSGLKRINFNGTKAQWNAIRKGDCWSYNTGNFTVYCTDGTISK